MTKRTPKPALSPNTIDAACRPKSLWDMIFVIIP